MLKPLYNLKCKAGDDNISADIIKYANAKIQRKINNNLKML